MYNVLQLQNVSTRTMEPIGVG